MKRTTLQVGPYAVNCSIVALENAVLVIDPGCDSARILAALDEQKLVPTAILLTHGHFDHIGGIEGLQKRHPELPVFVHPEDVQFLGHPRNAFLPDYPQIPVPRNIRDATAFALADVIETPGHTPGGVCYHFREEGVVFTGDTLFAGSAGRTDFPGGSMAALLRSLAKLKALPDATRVVPGHGPETTIAAEKRSNPFLQP